MKAAARIARKELRDILREKSIVVALLVQFFIAAFSAFLAVGLLALYDPGSAQADIRANVAYTGPGGFDLYLDDGPGGIRLRHVEPAAALDGFNAGRFHAVVQEEWSDANGTRTVTLLLPDGQLQTTLLVTQLKDLLEDYERDLRTERQDRLQHTLREVQVEGAQQAVPYPFLFATLVPLLLLTPVFLSGAVAADSLSAELQSKTLALLRSAPASLPSVLAGKLLVPLALAPLQFLLWAALLALNGIHAQNLALLALLGLCLTMLLAGIGFALAARLRRDGPTQAAYALAAIAQAVLSLLLPRDPLNLVAVLASGRVDAEAWASLGILGLVAVAVLWLGFADAARSIRRRPD